MSANVYLHHDGQFFQGNIRTKVRMEEGKIQFIDIDHHVSSVMVFHLQIRLGQIDIKFQITHSLQINDFYKLGQHVQKDGGCSQKNDHHFENCAIKVSNF